MTAEITVRGRRETDVRRRDRTG